MRTSVIILAPGLLTAVYATGGDRKHFPIHYKHPACDYVCSGKPKHPIPITCIIQPANLGDKTIPHLTGNEPPLGCQNVTAHHCACGPFEYNGCYNDPHGGILLTERMSGRRFDEENRQESCAQTCYRWEYFAISDEICQCGDYLHKWATKVDAVQCRIPCAGSFTQFCAPLGLSMVYRKRRNATETRDWCRALSMSQGENSRKGVWG